MQKIGVLAMQGAFAEHISLLKKLPDIQPFPVRTEEELSAADALILPGGESTAMRKLLNYLGLTEKIKKRIADGMPVWGTCAGMILLAKEVEGEPASALGIMDIRVKRNAYGSQLDSFAADMEIPDIAPGKRHLIFIRAPYITAAGLGVQILAERDGQIIAARENNMLVTSFHPELTEDPAFHRYFADMIGGGK